MSRPDDGAADHLLRHAMIVDGLDTSLWTSAGTYRGWQEGGVTAVNATIAIWEGYDSTLWHVQEWLRRFHEFSELIRPVHTAADIVAAHREGRTGVILGWQNSTPLGDDLDRLLLFHALGVRIIQLTYNEHNLLGDGCYEPNDDGLSRFGRDAVREMNRVGVLVDLSHCGDRTTLDAIEHSERPVAITHANARSQHRHPRNKTDDAIRAMADRGGVIGANAFPQFFPEGYRTTLETYIDAIEYLVDLVGVEHVGIGTDFCHDQPLEWFRWIFSTDQGRQAPESLPEMPRPHRHLVGFESARQFPALVEGLCKRGFDEAAIAAIVGGNWVRLFGQVWAST